MNSFKRSDQYTAQPVSLSDPEGREPASGRNAPEALPGMWPLMAAGGGAERELSAWASALAASPEGLVTCFSFFLFTDVSFTRLEEAFRSSRVRYTHHTSLQGRNIKPRPAWRHRKLRC